jgi:hypothetical protein
MADLVTVGVSASSWFLSSSSVLSRLDRARGAVSARELLVMGSICAGCPSLLLSQCPPPPRPPGTNLRLLFGGSVASSLRELTRDLAGVRVGRRSDRSVEAMLAVNGAVFARGVVSAVQSGEMRLANRLSHCAGAVQRAHGFVREQRVRKSE